MKTITKIIIEVDDDGNMFLNGDLVPTFNPLRANNNPPLPCTTCLNNPSNGGSGICNCILGNPITSISC